VRWCIGPIPLQSPTPARKKNGFVTATKLGTTNEFFDAYTKNFAAATKGFCYPYFKK